MSLDLAQVESLCQRLYNSQVTQEREEAEKVLGALGQNKEHLLTCREILDNSRSPFAQLFASTSFRRLVTEHEFAPNIRLEMRNYVLEYLIKNVSGLESFVVSSLIRLVCRIVRIGWFEEQQQRQIVESCQKLILAPASMGQYLLGVQVLEGLIVEMNTSHKRGRSSSHGSRKTSMSFRDDELMKIFRISLDALGQAKSVTTDERFALMETGLNLAIVCMTFDFIGSGYDESADEPNTIQIPSQWRSLIDQPGLVELCFYLYSLEKLSVSRLAIELLVHISSVRRSIFPSEDERRKFLARFVETSLAILKTRLHLQDTQIFNSFCKFLGRLKANYNLQDLVTADGFREWIGAVTEFTLKALTQWQCASGSVIHLITLWARMATSLSYVKSGESSHSIQDKIPEIVHAYINSRMECVVGANNGVIEDPLDDEGSVQEQLDSFHQLCRFNYANTRDVLNRYFEPLLQEMNQMSSRITDPVQIAITEGKLTWIVHIISCIIKGRPTSPSELSDSTDGDLSSKVFLLCHVLQQGQHVQRNSEVSRQKLDVAILSFLDSFRAAYIAENRMHASRLFLQMSERLGDNAEALKSEQLLELIVDRIVWNLQFYASVPALITPSLRLFRDVANTFVSSKSLPKLTTIKKMLSGSGSDFVFLTEEANARNRTLFYFIVSRLLFNEDVLSKFQSFVSPIHQVLEGLRSFTTPDALRSNVPANTVIGVFRDLRGMLEAAISDRYYGFIFDWLHSHYFPVIVNCIEAWVDQPEVTTPVLKFMTEFAYNRSSRISFGVCSPNGYHLFRLVSQVVVAYGRRVIHFPKEGNQYRLRLKGTWICFLFFSRALIGNYANFGVFHLYGDPALSNAMEVTLKMMTMLSPKEIVEYKKIGRAYFPLLDKLMENHMDYVAKLDFQNFRSLMTSVEAGLKSFDTSFCSTCSAAVDKLATYYYTYVVAPTGFVISVPEAAKSLDRLIQMWPTLFPSFLKTLIDIALFEEASAMWSLSQPILALIVINESWFAQIKEDLVREQPEGRQKHVMQCLSKLMEDIERNLEPKNRETFSHNLSVLKHGFKGKKTPKKSGVSSGMSSRQRVWKVCT